MTSRPVPPGGAYAAALALLGRREISRTALRARLVRRGFPADEVDEALERLARDGTVDDRRTARAAAHLEGTIRMRGRRRVLQKVRGLGIDADTAAAAVDEVFADIDEDALLDRALARRLAGLPPGPLDRRAKARIAQSLMRQDFPLDAVMAHIRRRRTGEG